VGEAPTAPKASASSKPGQAKNSQQPGGAAAPEDEGYQIIETPFGPIKRKIK
jgi:hypothetical protein